MNWVSKAEVIRWGGRECTRAKEHEKAWHLLDQVEWVVANAMVKAEKDQICGLYTM